MQKNKEQWPWSYPRQQQMSGIQEGPPYFISYSQATQDVLSQTMLEIEIDIDNICEQ